MDNTTPNQPQFPQYPQYQPVPPTNRGQPPYGQPPYGQPPTGRRLPQLKRWQWIAAGVGALVIVCCLCGTITSAMNGASSTNTTQTTASAPTSTHGPTAIPQPTATNTPTPKWTVTHTYTGNGIKQTPTFTAPDDWRLVWSCKPSSSYVGEYNVIVTVYNSDGTLSNIVVNTICKAGNTGDVTEVHGGGSIYLDVNSEAYWELQVEELK